MERDQKSFETLISGIIVCPFCGGELERQGGSLLCRGANHGPFKKDGAGPYYFLAQDDEARYVEKHDSGINRLKSFFKRLPWLYYVIWNIFCPVWVSRRGFKKLFALLPPHAVVLNLGSGPRRIREEWVNVDVVPLEYVDVVADATKLPFRSSSVDAVVNESLFEHLSDPMAVAKEIERVLKPGGVLYTSTPFMTPYHASPDDFGRWTLSGLGTMFSGFAKIEDGVDAGPWSALLVFLAYWLGVVFSFGFKKYAPTLAFVFMVILGPLKIFDFVFRYFPGSEAVAAQLYFIGRKPK